MKCFNCGNKIVGEYWKNPNGHKDLIFCNGCFGEYLESRYIKE